jgi:hypothetical protein
MLTVEVKLNGRLVGYAKLVNSSDRLPEVSDYALDWSEAGRDFLLEGGSQGRAIIEGHRRKLGAWALVARAVEVILGQKVERMEAGHEEDLGQARVWQQVGRDHK